jgi:hypothetical protein
VVLTFGSPMTILFPPRPLPTKAAFEPPSQRYASREVLLGPVEEA